jgi:hypothetical protein
MSASFAFHKALHAALAANPALAAIVGARIYDAPPRDATFPYVTQAETSTADWSTSTENGGEHRLTLHAWSRTGGKAECWSILDAIRDALHDAALAIEAQALVNLRFERAATSLDADGRTWHGIARFRAVTEPA